jgi:hypothetical protein
MSEKHEGKTAVAGDEGTSPPERDWLLQKIVSTANETGAEIGVTLIVGGTVISGQAISGKQYFAEFGKSFAAANVFNNDQRKAIEETYKEFGEKRYASLPAAELWFVHLKNVVIWHGEEPSRLPLFRVRFAAIEGFTIGTLDVAP